MPDPEVRIGRGYVELGTRSGGLRSQVRAEVAAAGAGQQIDVPVNADTRGLWRDLNGRLRDQRGRFAKAGEESGRAYVDSISKAIRKSKNPLGDIFGAFASIAIPAKLMAITAAAGPATAAILGLAASLGTAMTTAAAGVPMLLGLAGGLLTVKLAIRAMQDEALAGSKTVKTFNKSLKEFKKALKPLEKTAMLAIIPGITEALNILRGVLPGLRQEIYNVGYAFGSAARDVAKLIASPLFQRQLSVVLMDNTAMLRGFAGAALPLTSVLMTLAEATSWMGAAVAESTQRWLIQVDVWLRAKRVSGELAAYFRVAAENLKIWLGIIADLGATIVNVLRAALGPGQRMAATLREWTAQMRQWSGSASGQAQIRQFFDYIQSVDTRQILAVASAVSAVGLALKGLAIGQSVAGVVAGLASMGPVGITILAVGVAVAALAGAVVYLYQVSEPVRDSVNSLWQGLQDNLLPVLQRMYGFVMNEVAPLFEGRFVESMRAAADFIVEKLLPALKEYYMAVLPHLEAAIRKIIQAIKDNKEEIQWMLDKFKSLVEFATTTLIPVLGNVAGVIWDVVGFAISNAINLVGSLIDKIRAIYDTAVSVGEVIGGALMAIYLAFEFVFGLIKEVVRVAWNFIDALTGGKLTAIKERVKRQFGLIKDEVGRAVDTVKELWGRAWDWASEKLKKVGGSIKDTWNDVKDGLITAFRAFPRSVYNGFNKLIDGLNNLIGKFSPYIPIKIPRIGHLKMPEGYAGGGQVRGKGTGTSDSVPIRASTGEFVLRAGAVSALSKVFGGAFLPMLNRYDISGDSGAMTWGKPRGYAAGGRVSRTQSFIRSTDPLPYRFGAVGPDAYDCSGLVGEAWARTVGRPSYRRYFTTADIVGKGGFVPGRGTFTIGLSDSHVVGNLGGLPFEAASTASGIRVGSSARSVTQMPRQYYLPSAGGNFIGDSGGLSFTAYIRKLIEKAAAGIKKRLPMPEGLAGDMVSGAFDRVVDGVKSFEFDQGGIMPPGPGVFYNGTSRPETVRNASQEAALRTGGTTYVFEPGSVTVDASKLRGMDDLIKVIHGLETSVRARTGGTARYARAYGNRVS
jgi:hypothetical protein